MIESTFSTAGLPPADRWPSWYEFGYKSHVPTVIRTAHQDDFQGTFRLLDLGAIQVSALTYSPLEVFRTAKLIRQSDPDVYFLVRHLYGRIGVAQSGRAACLGTGDLVFYDTSKPFESWATADQGEVAGCVTVQIPRGLVPIPTGTLEPLMVSRLPGRQGLASLLSAHLAELARNAADYTAADATRLAIITVDLFTALCAHELEADRKLPPEAGQRALQLRIHGFIQERLGDPALSPRMIAAAHGISLRYLQKLFQGQGRGVAEWIRWSRLERCRRELADPRARHRTVQAIASRWGFTSGAHFSRLFRATYGIAPGEYRNLVHEPLSSAPTIKDCALNANDSGAESRDTDLPIG